MHASGDAYAFEREWPCIVQKGRPLDKAEGGALTTALAYTYRDVLGIPRDDQLAAMDRRNDVDDEPKEKRDALAPHVELPSKADEAAHRDLKPANDSATPADDAPDSRPVLPRTSEHPFRRLLPLIQSRAMKPELLASEVDRADVDKDERIALDLVCMAYRTQNQKDFLALSSKIRTSFPSNEKGDRLRDWTLGAIKLAWDELTATPAEQPRAS